MITFSVTIKLSKPIWCLVCYIVNELHGSLTPDSVKQSVCLKDRSKSLGLSVWTVLWF